MCESTKITRRDFVKKTVAAAAALTIVPRAVLGGPGFTAPSDELTNAVIGVGGMGSGHIDYEGSRLLAVCDVDSLHLAAALEFEGELNVHDTRCGKRDDLHLGLEVTAGLSVSARPQAQLDATGPAGHGLHTKRVRARAPCRLQLRDLMRPDRRDAQINTLHPCVRGAGQMQGERWPNDPLQ